MKQVAMELDGDFEDRLTFTFIGEPGMRDVGAYEDELEVVDLFHAATNDATDAFGVFDKVELIFLMVMHGEIEFRFITGINRKTIGLC